MIFLDVFTVAQQGLATIDELWGAWARKNPGSELASVKAQLLRRLEELEARRPLAIIGKTPLKGELTVVKSLFDGSQSAATGEAGRRLESCKNAMATQSQSLSVGFCTVTTRTPLTSSWKRIDC